jgi:S1-C subfamily serine protease
MEQTPISRTGMVLPLLLAAVLGGGVAAGVTVALTDGGGDGTTTTIVRQSGLGTGRENVENGLTPRDIYRRYAPGVVFVRAEVVRRGAASPFDLFPQEQRSESTGSGFVIDKAGDILTNNHVIDGATKVSVQFADKHTLKATVVGRDPSTDLALLRFNAEGQDLTPLPLGSSKDVQVGDPTIAIGNPFGLDRTLTTGVVSALQRQIQAPNGFAINDVIQTDAAINPGNSGGPLIDAAGRVIGINSQIETGGSSSGNVGIGFAVPIDTAKRILDDLKKSGSVERAYLGVTSATVDGSLSALDLPVKTGALVQRVEPSSPAATAGLRAGDISAQVNGQQLVLGGDIVTKVDGHPIRSGDQLASVVAARKPGDAIRVTFVRDGRAQTVTVKLGNRPSTLGNG